MNTIYFYLYVSILILFLVFYSILKCYYKINIFDPLLFIDEKKASISELTTFYTFNISFYFFFGYFFKFDILVSLILKVIFIELLLTLIFNCNFLIVQINNIESTVNIIIISIFSYLLGATFRHYKDILKF